mgnify:CR=1 FL=1
MGLVVLSIVMAIRSAIHHRIAAHRKWVTGSYVGLVIAGVAAMAVLARLTETMQIQWTGQFMFALGWLVLVLSVGAVGLLYTLIRRGEVILGQIDVDSDVPDPFTAAEHADR